MITKSERRYVSMKVIKGSHKKLQPKNGIKAINKKNQIGTVHERKKD
jgi:hypothetical protein